MKKLLLRLIRFYRRAISPLFPPTCRFVPTCSQYALEAIEKYGAVKGGWLALKRFLSQDAGMILDMGCRCHLRGDIHEIGGSTHTVNLTHLGKFVDERHDIHRTLLHIHLLYSLIDFLMTRLIEGGWLQHL